MPSNRDMKPKTGRTKKTETKRSRTRAATQQPDFEATTKPSAESVGDDTPRGGHEQNRFQQAPVAPPEGSAGDCATRDRLKKLLQGRFRRKYPISPERVSALLDNVLELSGTRLKTPKADTLVNKILDSGDYLALAISSPAFVRDILGWPEDKADTWLLLLRDHRWAEVEDITVPMKFRAEVELLLDEEIQLGGIESSTGADDVPVTSPHSENTGAETGSSKSALPPDLQPIATSAGGSASPGEQIQPPKYRKKPAPPSPNIGDEAAPLTSAPVNTVKDQSFAAADNHVPTATGQSPLPSAPVTNGGAVTLPAVEPAVNPRLSKKETALLSECEAIIRENRQSFFELGEALRTIRDGNLYRQHYTTFEEYCRKKWDFTRAWAYAQLKAVNVRDNICQPMVDTGKKLPEPTNERQVRPLAVLEADHQRAAWKRAVELADGKEITGSLVQKAVREMKAASTTADKPADAFDPDTAWKGLEKLLVKRLALWPDHMHGDLRTRLQAFTAERLSVSAET